MTATPPLQIRDATWGVPEVGRKFDRWLDLVSLQLIIDP